MDLLIRHVEPLLYEYKVDIGFYGHNHAVQRHASVYQKEVKQYSRQVVNADGSISNVFEDPPATVHFVIGTGGAMFTMNAVEPRPAWNEAFFSLSSEHALKSTSNINVSGTALRLVLSTQNYSKARRRIPLNRQVTC